MGLIVKSVLAFCIGWAALHYVQQQWLGTVAAQVTEPSGLQLAAPTTVLPSFEIDPDKMRLAINPPVEIDTKKYERIAIESMTNDMIRRNNEAPPHISGFRH